MNGEKEKKKRKNKNFSQMVKPEPDPHTADYSLSPQVIIFIVSQFKRQKTWANFVRIVRFVWRPAQRSVWFEVGAAAVQPKAKALME